MTKSSVKKCAEILFRGVRVLSSLVLWVGCPAEAGVFNLTRFLSPTEWSLGLEPELILTSGAGLGFNAKFTYGLNELSNIQLGVGNGSGPRGFRAGGAMTFDFVPDLENQPGLGVAAQGYYLRTGSAEAFEITAIPYIHKSFRTGQANEFEPYFSFPFGTSFRSGNYSGTGTFVLGSHFRFSGHFRTTLELGVAAANTESYLSTGFTYAP